MDLRRFAPEPIPPIHAVPEYEATGRLASWYEDVKAVLQVPWMGVVTMAYAHYPEFFGALWQGLRPLAASEPFVREAEALRTFLEREVTRLEPPPLDGRLGERGYKPREIDQIRALVEVFSHGNYLYALIATLARLLTEEGEPAEAGLAGGEEAAPCRRRHAPEVRIPFVLMEPHHADAPTRLVYEDIKQTLGLPVVNTDYRALARWPSYFALAWSDLKPHVRGAAHEALCRGCHEGLLESVSRLPNPGALAGEPLREAARRDGSGDAILAEIRGLCRLFQWLLPGLMVNVAFFRHQLRAA